jgi:hypothetical protein
VADLLHPPDVQLKVRAARCQRVQAAFSAPGQEATPVGLGVWSPEEPLKRAR